MKTVDASIQDNNHEMMIDPRWLQILKASSGQACAVAIACWSLLILERHTWIPSLDAWLIQLIVFIGLLSTMLFLVGIASSANLIFKPRIKLQRWMTRRREAKEAERYIPFMSEKEREIISYLLQRKEKMFTAASDGGYAATLISRRIIVLSINSGLHYSIEDVPMMIPDHIWDVLERNKTSFQTVTSENSPHPWRVPWALR